MIRTLALIACLAGAAYGSLSWDSADLLVRFDYTITGIGTDAFIPMPVYKVNATEQGWAEYPQPSKPEGYSSLVMLCPVDELTVCMLYDDTGYAGGLQIGVDTEYASDAVYDWEAQGFTSWTVELSNGTSKTYWTISQYYISPDELATSAETRVANRDSTKLLQFDNIWVSGFEGELFNISTNTDYVTGSGSPYTKQACIPWMGNHYYYNMTTSLECLDGQIFSWFPLVYSDQLVGVGFMSFFNYSASNKWYENPSQTAVKVIVPDAPDCLYNMADTPGAVTMHTYFVEPAWTMSCIVE